ncbi:MAG TPA: prepilin peptidase [Planctomycetaceae bacterium]|nr:prepilin peptidase [Planctomycetaceae bacterium]
MYWATLAVAGFGAGALVGALLARWIDAACQERLPGIGGGCLECGFVAPGWRRWPVMSWSLLFRSCPACGGALRRDPFAVELATAALFALFLVAYFFWQCQKLDEVQPDTFWYYGRALYHLTLMALLITATGTDLREYMIPDSITIPGVLIGFGLATVSGDLQMIHLWVDWNEPTAFLLGPYIPDWIKTHPHWHGAAWSGAGLVVGGGLVWLTRLIANAVLGKESLGFGDVTLMAMVGSFIGWQPVVCVYLLAPLCAVLVGLALRLLHNRAYLPYGPYLAAATGIVMLSWRWIWTFPLTPSSSVRHVFGDPVALAMVGGTALSSLAALLGFLRLARRFLADTP